MITTVRTSDFIISTPEISIYAIRTSFVNAVTAIFFPVMPGMLVLLLLCLRALQQQYDLSGVRLHGRRRAN